MSNSPAPAPSSPAVPTVARRLISMVYETLLGLAVLFLPFLVFEIATQASHAKVVEHMRQALAFLVLGAYFIHQWSREGQTLAMRTWRIKLVMPGREHVPLQAAVVRYLLAWLWIVPAALLDYALGLAHWQALGVLGAGILAWSATAWFDKDGQFLHDRLTGTRLVQLPKPEKKKKAA
ncbi:RDD family protein [Duganella sp. FT3S]|uniref:RDD family protein n=1 Tax=Rugamonas fusca TaxID=2758568 RepID=A0A7W2I9C6_9BURK|nr:RDD family protein [Rugamonas fusca]MBA5608449.1 RDD family protein [Rugamonas fusca]